MKHREKPPTLDANGWTDDYELWARSYFAMARSIVSRAPGVHPQDVEDLTQEIMLKFYVKDFLTQYDPTKRFNTPSGTRTARFPTLFRSFVRKFLRTPVETYAKRNAREPVRLEQPTPGGEMWIEVYGPADPDEALALVELREEMRRAYRHLGTICVNEDGEAETTLGEVFRELVVESGGVVSDELVVRRRAARALRVSDTTITRWIGDMRRELQVIGFPHGGEYMGEGVPA